MGCTFLYEEIV